MLVVHKSTIATFALSRLLGAFPFNFQIAYSGAFAPFQSTGIVRFKGSFLFLPIERDRSILSMIGVLGLLLSVAVVIIIVSATDAFSFLFVNFLSTLF